LHAKWKTMTGQKEDKNPKIKEIIKGLEEFQTNMTSKIDTLQNLVEVNKKELKSQIDKMRDGQSF